MDILKTDYINSLLDIYAELLTPYQQEIMDLYYQEDLSLKEIADEKEISRNAVFTLINRVEKILINYEDIERILDNAKFYNYNSLLQKLEKEFSKDSFN